MSVIFRTCCEVFSKYLEILTSRGGSRKKCIAYNKTSNTPGPPSSKDTHNPRLLLKAYKCSQSSSCKNKSSFQPSHTCYNSRKTEASCLENCCCNLKESTLSSANHTEVAPCHISNLNTNSLSITEVLVG